jgi:hypothetical protein
MVLEHLSSHGILSLFPENGGTIKSGNQERIRRLVSWSLVKRMAIFIACQLVLNKNRQLQ